MIRKYSPPTARVTSSAFNSSASLLPSSANTGAGLSGLNLGQDTYLWDSSWVQAVETDMNVTNGLADANMAIFAGLTDPVITLTADVHPVIGQGPAQISGFQIVPGRTAPAIPSAIDLVGGAVVVEWAGVGVLQNTTHLPADDWTDVDGGTVTNGPYVVPTPTPPVESFRLREP